MFGNNKERTPAQKAQRAQLGIFARLAGCAYLIYIMVKILRTPGEEANTSTVTIIAIIMLVLSVFVIAITLREFYFGLKSGRYKAATYYEEEAEEYLRRKESEDVETDEDADTELLGDNEDSFEDIPDNDDEDENPGEEPKE